MRIEGLSRHDYPGKVHVQYSDGIHTLLHMLVFSALTKRSPDTKVVAVPMLRETLLGQQRYKARIADFAGTQTTLTANRRSLFETTVWSISGLGPRADGQ